MKSKTPIPHSALRTPHSAASAGLPPLLLRHFARVADAPNAVPRLRQFILDLAVRGKLVEQDPNDEPASDLLKRIRAENARLVKEGMVKERELLPRVPEEDESFPVPPTWQWVRFGELAEFAAGRTPSRNDTSFWNTGDYRWVSIADMKDGEVINATRETVSERAKLQLFRTDPPPAGTMIMSFKLTIGKISRLGVPAFHNEAIIAIHPYVTQMDPFLFMVLPNFARQGNTKDAIKGATLNRDSLTNICLPLPPLAEQHRIVAKVDELMALCDRLEATQAERETRRTRLVASTHASLAAPSTPKYQPSTFFVRHLAHLTSSPTDIPHLRQTILNLAIRGKLVPQDPTDELASTSLGSSRAASPRTVAWALPTGWAWSSLGRIGKTIGGGTPSKSEPSFWRGKIPWVSPKDMKVLLISDAQDHISESALEASAAKLIPAGALLVVVRGMILAHSFPTALTSAPVAINQDMKAIVPFRQDIAKMLLLLIRGLKPQVLQLVEHSTHGTCKLLTEQLFALPLPIPPLAEQHRIVAKVDELMALCDRLEAQLTTTQTQSRRLLESTLHQALATT